MPTAQHRRVELACAVPSAPLALDADRDQLRQAMMNLMLNALEAISKEGWVRVEILADPEQVRLRVLDNGPGLSADIAQRLGEAFQTTKPEGVGLGLAVARQVAEGQWRLSALFAHGRRDLFRIILARRRSTAAARSFGGRAA